MGSTHTRRSLLVGVLSLAAAQAPFRLSNVFGSNMVIQRDGPSPVWGWTKAGDTVTTTFNGGKLTSAPADAAGLWVQRLPPTPAGGPFELSFTTSSGGDTLSLTNVLVGDVYICSGQSNMCFGVHQAFNATAECARGVDPHYTNMRFTTTAHNNAPNPEDQLGGVSLPWTGPTTHSICSPGNFTDYSATCYFSARNVYDALNGTVPIGLINSCVSGTSIDSWSPLDAIAMCPGLHGYGTYCNNEHGCLYNAMVAGFVHAPGAPLNIKGILWYQGENDVAVNSKGVSDYYDCAFRAMITSWRTHFGQPDLFFGFVMLAPWARSGGDTNQLPPTRLAQLNATTLPNVGMSAAYDLGDPTSPWPGHPRNKQDVGLRMSAAMLAKIYGHSVPYTGPQLSSATAIGSGSSIVVTLSFVSSSLSDCGTGSPLVLNTAVTCPAPIPAKDCESFAVQTSDGAWRPTTGAALSSDKKQLLLSVGNAPSGAGATAVRGMFADWPLAMLHNGCGFPLEPFVRTL